MPSTYSLLAAVLLAYQAELPNIAGPVDDRLNLLPPQSKAELVAQLNNLEATDSTQLVVLIVATTAPYSVEDYANRTFAKNAIGQKHQHNGVLIVVARDDRRCRIEVGYGLEGRLTDALSSHIIRNEMVPRFKSGDFAGGITAGTRAVVAAVKSEYKAPAPSAAGTVVVVVIILSIVTVFVLMITMRRRWFVGGHRRGWGWASYGSSSWANSGWGSSWSSGGSSWSGGGSSWSGGGGSSGGGGASGSW